MPVTIKAGSGARLPRAGGGSGVGKASTPTSPRDLRDACASHVRCWRHRKSEEVLGLLLRLPHRIEAATSRSQAPPPYGAFRKLEAESGSQPLLSSVHATQALLSWFSAVFRQSGPHRPSHQPLSLFQWREELSPKAFSEGSVAVTAGDSQSKAWPRITASLYRQLPLRILFQAPLR